MIALVATTPERLLMPLREVVAHSMENGRIIARTGIGTCPHCGREGEAEAGRVLYCPVCAGEVLAVLPRS